jgi:cell division protein FtsW
MRLNSTVLLGLVLALLSLGIVVLASTSSVRGEVAYGDPYHFLKRQLLWLGLSLAAGGLLFRFDYHGWQKLAGPVALGAVLLMGLVLVPRLGLTVGGSTRWLCLGPLSFQPSEAAKFGLVAALAWWMSRLGPKVRAFREGFLCPVLALGVVVLLLLKEPDFGTAILLSCVALAVLFVGGTRLPYIALGGIGGMALFAVAVLLDPVRLGRVMAFLRPEVYPATAYHLAQSRIAFHLGGWFGKGLGNSIQKYLYLPEAHTDFILAIIGEELGFAGTVFVLLAFVGIFVTGMRVALKAPDTFGHLLAFGLTVMLSLQAIINIGAVTGCMPTKGLPLPFISYGGSSLLLAVCAVAVLLNIAVHGEQQHLDEHSRSIRDLAHTF